MVTFFNLLTHLLVVVGILSIFYFIGYMIWKTNNLLEKVIRISSFTTGLLIYVGARAVGISMPAMMMGAVSTTNPLSIGLMGVIFPTLLGILVVWYCIRNLNRSEHLASRLIILITTFVVVLFGDVYVNTYRTSVQQGGLDVSLLPNLTFTIGLSLYVIFNYKGKEAKKDNI